MLHVTYDFDSFNSSVNSSTIAFMSLFIFIFRFCGITITTFAVYYLILTKSFRTYGNCMSQFFVRLRFKYNYCLNDKKLTVTIVSYFKQNCDFNTLCLKFVRSIYLCYLWKNC